MVSLLLHEEKEKKLHVENYSPEMEDLEIPRIRTQEGFAANFFGQEDSDWGCLSLRNLSIDWLTCPFSRVEITRIHELICNELHHLLCRP